MSSTLMYRIPAKGKSLPDELKFVLRSNSNYSADGYEWTREELPYLQGLTDAKVKGAKELKELIEKYGSVETYLEY